MIYFVKGTGIGVYIDGADNHTLRIVLANPLVENILIPAEVSGSVVLGETGVLQLAGYCLEDVQQIDPLFRFQIVVIAFGHAGIVKVIIGSGFLSAGNTHPAATQLLGKLDQTGIDCAQCSHGAGIQFDVLCN